MTDALDVSSVSTPPMPPAMFPGNELEFSSISGKFDTEPKLERSTWAEYVATLTKPRERADEDGPAAIFARFRTGERRDEAVEYLTALVLRIDGKSRDEIVRLLAGYRYAAYTRFDSCPDHPKWTVVIPYSRRAWVGEHVLAYLIMREKFGGCIDPSCANPSTFFFEPSCPSGAKDFYDSIAMEGMLLDPSQLAAKASLSGLSVEIPCSDCGNALRLVKLAAGRFRYCGELDRWLEWNGTVWEWDRNGSIVRLAKQVPRALLREAADAIQPARQDELRRWSRDSGFERRIEAMIKLAKSEPGIHLLSSQLDADPMLLGVKNGIVDLRSGTLRAASPRDYVTKFAAASWVPGATCPRWEKFLSDIFAGNQETIRYVQRLVGYMLTGITSEQCMVILHGLGANGKTVFTETIKRLLGDYAITIAPHVLMARKQDGGPTPEIARLRDVRLALAAESDEGAVLAVGFIKSVTGEETISARELHKAPIEFRPSFKLALTTNHPPVVNDEGHSIWRRLQMIPFEVTFAKERQNPNLQRELLEELPGILAWAVEGCLAWRREGLNPPAKVKAATEQYRSDMDWVGNWLGDCCLVDSPDALTPFADLYESYDAWRLENGAPIFSKQAFGRKLEQRGYRNARDNRAQRCRRGIRLFVTM